MGMLKLVNCFTCGDIVRGPGFNCRKLSGHSWYNYAIDNKHQIRFQNHSLSELNRH